MWDTYSGEDKARRVDSGKLIRWGILAAMAAIIFAIASHQAVNLFLNFSEFGVIYTKTLYYASLSGIILAAIAFARVNGARRHSVIWYFINLIARIIKRNDRENTSSRQRVRYADFQMSPLSFWLWQVTKIVMLAPLFSNIAFGMAVSYLAEGKDIGVGSLGSIFLTPFEAVPTDGTFAQTHVLPAMPALSLLIPSLIGAVGMRLLVYVGISSAINIVSQYAIDSAEHKPKILFYIAKVEVIMGVATFWAGFILFFNEAIDYNTKYVIAGALLLGSALITFGLLDKKRSRVIIYPTKMHVYSRIFTVIAVIAAVGLIVAVNASIAEAKKVEWRGPYIAQEIAVNRNMAGLDKVDTINYDVRQPTITTTGISQLINENRDTLDKIRLWDKDAATLKLNPELGQRNDVAFANTKMLRFSGNMYWTGITVPRLPETIMQGTEWFNEHMVYTHSDAGFKMLEANTGNIVNENKFFPQQRIYYGVSGNEGPFSHSWSAYPVGRTSSYEINQFFYNGTGGINVSPPISWMFEPNFMLSYPTTSIHLMRYKDVHDRMELLYPQFVYNFAFGKDDTTLPVFQKVGTIPVTDGKNTYWLMPLISGLDTSHVPWASPFMLTLVGYALIDSYNGNVQVIVTGNDAFSNLFYDQYKDVGATRNIPSWLEPQLRYPEEMFMWKVAKFSRYHVTDPKQFIEARQFYDSPKDGSRDVSPYYAVMQPPGFDNAEFVGFQSLELSGSTTKNLVGYMIVENDPPNLGKMVFYSIPLDSATKLIGPSAAREALEKDKDYKNIKTFLQGNPRVGENILYRVGGQDVYFIPVYTANTSGGVVSQIGTIAAVGASSTGSFNVGLGDNTVQAFENYLLKAAGKQPTAVTAGPTSGNVSSTLNIDVQDRLKAVERVFEDSGIQIIKPTAITAPLEFKESHATYKTETDFKLAKSTINQFLQANPPSNGRIYEWQGESSVNFGALKIVGGIVENHYITIEVR